MTRKQAVLEAIVILSNNPENDAIVKKLNELLFDLPCTSWTKASVLDAIENYTIEHNNILPNANELITQNNLPSDTTIRNLFGETSMREFLNKYFSKYIVKYKVNSPYQSYTKDQFKKIFIENYIRIKNRFHVKTVKVKLYDANKKDGSPHSCTIIKHCECNSYNDLLILCGLKEADKDLEVSIHISYNDSEKRDDELKNLFNNI